MYQLWSCSSTIEPLIKFGYGYALQSTVPEPAPDAGLARQTLEQLAELSQRDPEAAASPIWHGTPPTAELF
jgi:hypothetical protein